ncbi:MAG: hypothetical protein NTW87_05065 [Planctomycetota bacterium]|nr:hypothetical protein [Planctomycetota bacterium]
MPAVTATRKRNLVIVRNEYWEVQHDARQGGCWTSVRFFNGTRKNLLAAPVSARVRNLDPHPTSDAGSPFFFESKFERNARVTIENLPSGDVAVVAAGTLRLKTGEDIGVRYRQRYEYRAWGLVACELEIICPEGRDDIVEVCAVEMILREGMTDAYVREHPIRAATSDLLGMGTWYEVQSASASRNREAVYAARYVPVHIVCFERGREGIEFTCCSDIGGWDTAFCSDPGLGYYEVRPSWGNPAETLIALAPYCVVYRRNPTTIKGSQRLRYYFGLPFIKDRAAVGSPYVHAGTDSHWLSDAELEGLAKTGIRLIRFHNDYREDGPFWHDGMYPPYDQPGMAELKRIIATAHRLGMKIIPYVSVKEFHPETPGCKENREQWRQQPGPKFPEMHTWYGTGEFGQLMCLESGWLEFRKKSLDIILSDLPWDGLYFDWTTPHCCRNPNHNGGRIHSDQDAFYDFMYYARQRIGPDGILATHLSGLPQVVVENMSALALIFEDQNYSMPYPEPGKFPAQCEFMPITPRHLCGAPKAGTPDARRTIMSGILSGHPAIATALGGASCDPVMQRYCAFSNELVKEVALFGAENLASYRFAAAHYHAVATGQERVYAALWHKQGRALVYLGNYSPKAAKGAFRFDPKLPGRSHAKKLTLTQVVAPGRTKSASLSAGTLRKGVPYALKPWATALYRLES